MADISITQAHKLPHKKAKAAAQKVADQMAEEYDMESEWNGDVLLFKRSGVSGRLTVSDSNAHLEIKLGFLLKAFAPTIEEKVSAKMKKVFGAKA
ncbi:MAG TPA: polyhydroxyalkanoic acid system family protein [Noviherbaspirillum sp.]|uniref:polyhydroxyalkanoic acid system family protein n=1 Tax=Noviherbaspirillum sp. TaxID=1926288 RepID=UPI002D64C276|nr:polyhydroxyalkanoic acid system family protein [Noviherbaspirillum sp.]HYD96672.1 polyhydroxyalkanoic acid system family protein [Noviherbaspirillum sp.]